MGGESRPFEEVLVRIEAGQRRTSLGRRGKRKREREREREEAKRKN